MSYNDQPIEEERFQCPMCDEGGVYSDNQQGRECDTCTYTWWRGDHECIN